MNSSQPREIPGFYYDPDRKRYFPLTAAVKREQKKRKLQVSRKDMAFAAWESAVNEYHKSIRLLYFDSLSEEGLLAKKKLLVIANFLRLKLVGPAQKAILEITSDDIDPSNRNIRILGNCCFYSGLVHLIFLSSGGIIRYDKRMDSHGKVWWEVSGRYYVPLRNDGNSDHHKVVRIKSMGPNLFCCYGHRDSNSQGREVGNFVCSQFKHIPHDTGYLQTTQYYTKEFTLSSDGIGSLYESTPIPGGFVVSYGNRVTMFNWENSADPSDFQDTKRVTSGKRSTITCLESVTGKENQSVLYTGFRDGRIYSIPIDHNKKFGRPVILPVARTLRIDSIVSIHSLPNNKFLVSGISKELKNEQLLYVCQLSETSSNGKILTGLIRFSTGVQNVTRDTEMLSISRDGSFIAYGKKYVNDYEVFSTDYVQQKTDTSRESVAYPIAHMANYMTGTKDIDLSIYRLINIEIVNTFRRLKTVVLDVSCHQGVNYYEQPCAADTSPDSSNDLIDTLSVTFERIPSTNRTFGATDPVLKILTVPIF